MAKRSVKKNVKKSASRQTLKANNRIKHSGGDIPAYPHRSKNCLSIDHELVKKTYFEVQTVKGTARELSEIYNRNITRSAVQYHLTKAGIRTGHERLDGVLENRKPEVLPLPEPGEVRRHIITTAQNNTAANYRYLENLEALAAFYDAEIMVCQVTYNKATYGKKAVKPGTKVRSDEDELWYDEKLQDYFCNERIQLAPGLVYVGDMNIIPTAERPLRGLDNITGAASGIFPASKLAMESIASNNEEDTKFNYTTGMVTKKNYIQKKTGQKAEFHHVYGALLVEVESDGRWFVRQLNADGWNRVQDLDVIAEKGEVFLHDSDVDYKVPFVAGVIPGDIHESESDEAAMECLFGAGGVVDSLRPKNLFLHDFFSMRSRNHHELRSFRKMFTKFIQGIGNVREEVRSGVYRLGLIYRDFMNIYMVRSNHCEALEKWLDITDYKDDYENAHFYLSLRKAECEAIMSGDDQFICLEWAMKHEGLSVPVTFLKEDESVTLCGDSEKGIECGAYHGHNGPNGAKGTLTAFAKLARKVVIGHTHQAGIHNNVYMVGTTSKMKLGYNHGPSSWSHTFCIVYGITAKRTLVTIRNGKAWADRSDLY